MLLGFMSRFVPYVEDGSKTHSVREYMKKGERRAGEICNCYANPRQKNMRLLGRWPCVKVEPIMLGFQPFGAGYVLRVTIGEHTLSVGEANSFAWRDGFRDQDMPIGTAALDEMARYWIAWGRLADSVHAAPWHGELIHWKR